MANDLTVRVEGVNEVLRELRQFDKKATFKVRARVKKYTKFIPQVYGIEWQAFDWPSGFYHDGRTGIGKQGTRRPKIEVKLGGRLSTSTDVTGKTRERALLSIVCKSAPESIADMANTGQVSQALPGRASRVMWPVAEAIQPEIVRNVKYAYDKTAKEASVRMRWDAY